MSQPKVMGHSDRGPNELDEAKENLGLAPDAVTSEDDDPEALPSGEVVEQGDDAHVEPLERRARKGEGSRNVAGSKDAKESR